MTGWQIDQSRLVQASRNVAWVDASVCPHHQICLPYDNTFAMDAGTMGMFPQGRQQPYPRGSNASSGCPLRYSRTRGGRLSPNPVPITFHKTYEDSPMALHGAFSVSQMALGFVPAFIASPLALFARPRP